MHLDNKRKYRNMTKDEILELVNEADIRSISLWFTDIIGNVKSVMIPSGELESVIENGIWFDGSSIEGFARIAESDMVLRPDLKTFGLLPYTDSLRDRTARLIGNVYTPNGEPFIGDPRYALQRALQEAEDMGYRYMTGMELEFFLFYTDEHGQPVLNAPQDNAGYFDISNEPSHIVRREMVSALEAMGIGVASSHSETGHGQHEIDFHYADALVSADHIVTTRVILKTIAQQHGLHCTFMPRPIADMPGSGMHTHQSLHNLQTGENVFSDPDQSYGLSALAQHFLAGQLNHARGMSAILAPLVNSYKRLGTSFEAPVFVTWAHINRGALIRVPGVSVGKESNTRLEMRSPDPSSNPYLMMAVMLATGLEGIKQKLPLAEPHEEIYLARPQERLRPTNTLPTSLGEALDELGMDDVVQSALGPYISDRYMTAKRQEFEEYNRQVTDWELKRYLNRF